MKHWAEIEEKGVYWAMRFMLLAHKILGRYVFLLLLHPVVAYYFLSNKAVRQASLEYLGKLAQFAPESGVKADWSHSFKHILNFAHAMLDKLSAWRGEIGLNDIEFHGRQAFLDSMNGKRGALILGSHLGNIEISRALASLNEKTKLNILVHTKHAQQFNRLLNQASENQRMQLIQVSEIGPSVAVMLDEKISQGEFVFIVGDRIPLNSGRTAKSTFLGTEAEFAQGPFILASLLKCPIYTLFCLKQEKKYHLYFEHFADRVKLPRKSREQALQTYLDLYVQRLERHCVIAPLQWFNFYSYWQQPE